MGEFLVRHTNNDMQWVGHPRRQPALGERIHSLIGDRLHIDVREYLGGDLVCDGTLNRGIARERGDGRHVTIGIGDQILGPYGNPGNGRQNAGDHDEQGGDH